MAGKRYRSEVEMAQAVRRMIRAMAAKAEDGDPEFLGELLVLADHIKLVTDDLVVKLKRQGHTWQSIGDATGTTRQAAIMKWKPKVAASLGWDMQPNLAD